MRFGQAMTQSTTGTGMEIDHLVDHYPWQEVEGGTLVDVGGSMGAARYPKPSLDSRSPRLRYR